MSLFSCRLEILMIAFLVNTRNTGGALSPQTSYLWSLPLPGEAISSVIGTVHFLLGLAHLRFAVLDQVTFVIRLEHANLND